MCFDCGLAQYQTVFDHLVGHPVGHKAGTATTADQAHHAPAFPEVFQ